MHCIYTLPLCPLVPGWLNTGTISGALTKSTQHHSSGVAFPPPSPLSLQKPPAARSTSQPHGQVLNAVKELRQQQKRVTPSGQSAPGTHFVMCTGRGLTPEHTGELRNSSPGGMWQCAGLSQLLDLPFHQIVHLHL